MACPGNWPQVACDLCVRPFGVLLSNPRGLQFPGKHTHFQGHQQALFSGHGPLHLAMHSLRGQGGVGNGHVKMVAWPLAHNRQ